MIQNNGMPFKPSIHHFGIFLLFLCITFFIYHHDNKMHRLKKNCKVYPYQARESYLAHLLLDDLNGIEIGGAMHNPFCLNTINVDFTKNLTEFKQAEIMKSGHYLNVDVVASGDNLPFANETYDFVISSHAIEHFYDPIKTILEWFRVIRKNGLIFMIIPHKERTFDKPLNRTTLSELLQRHENPDISKFKIHTHHSVWITEDVMELCRHFGWKVVAMLDTDDKVGNGFVVVIQKPKM